MLAREKIIKCSLRLVERKYAVYDGPQSHLLLLEELVHLLIVLLGANRDTPIAMSEWPLSVQAVQMFNSLYLGDLLHHAQDRTGLPRTPKSSQEADEGHRSASRAKEPEVLRDRARAGVIDNEVNPLAISDLEDSILLAGRSLVVDAVDVRA